MKRGGTMTGAVSLVMIFCVLCMAVFAVLTLSTAAHREKTPTQISSSVIKRPVFVGRTRSFIPAAPRF